MFFCKNIVALHDATRKIFLRKNVAVLFFRNGLCTFPSSKYKTREGFFKKNHSCGLIFFKTVLYIHILNTYLFH